MGKKYCSGILEITPTGSGRLRNVAQNLADRETDPYVSTELIEKLHLREGLQIKGPCQVSGGRKNRPVLTDVELCNGKPISEYAAVPELKSLTSIDPEEPFILTEGPDDLTGRLLDLFVPVGRGQRGLIVSPPKAGKTTMLKKIANAICANHKDLTMYVLLVDERPEEVTDFKRSVFGATVFHSSADQDVESHLRLTHLVMNMAIRQVEYGEDVVILIDSLTRMGRAFNKDSYSGGKTLSGGLAVNALEYPRRFFGAARNVEGGGSLTILATILVQTNSRMDEVIFQEFKGTGNLELVLSRECANRRLFPAIDLKESGTRKEHKLLKKHRLNENYALRRKTADMKAPDALEWVFKHFKTRM